MRQIESGQITDVLHLIAFPQRHTVVSTLDDGLCAAFGQLESPPCAVLSLTSDSVVTSERVRNVSELEVLLGFQGIFFEHLKLQIPDSASEVKTAYEQTKMGMDRGSVYHALDMKRVLAVTEEYLSKKFVKS